MHKNNARFLQNPEAYLRSTAIECYNIKADALKTAMTKVGESSTSTTVNSILEFDLVPQTGNYVSLVILGAIGAYAATKRKGQPIVAAWMPYLGQISNPDESKIGRINLTTVPAQVKFVFSAGLGGCNFVAQQDGVSKILYHEPTAAAWQGANPNYNGRLLIKAGPAYRDDHNEVGGFGMAMRHGGGWRLLFQLVNGVTVVDVTHFDIP
ncbi:MAG TPA: hypothetical protein VGL00_23125 [Terracidiphilus sp.]|jgi:hypothetical protein